MDAFAEVSNGVFIWCFIHRAPLVLLEVVVVQCVCVSTRCSNGCVILLPSNFG